jgi:hypothetical protein
MHEEESQVKNRTDSPCNARARARAHDLDGDLEHDKPFSGGLVGRYPPARTL